MMETAMTKLTLAALLLPLAACGSHYIKGTRVRDTRENHAIYDVIEDVRVGMEERNTEKVLAHVSPQYFEDMGTPEPADDYGYEQLKALVADSFSSTKEMHVILDIHAITVEEDKAYVDVRYASRARIELPSGGSWDAHREFNRIDFVRDHDTWLIVGGL